MEAKKTSIHEDYMLGRGFRESARCVNHGHGKEDSTDELHPQQTPHPTLDVAVPSRLPASPVHTETAPHARDRRWDRECVREKNAAGNSLLINP